MKVVACLQQSTVKVVACLQQSTKSDEADFVRCCPEFGAVDYLPRSLQFYKNQAVKTANESCDQTRPVLLVVVDTGPAVDISRGHRS